MTDQSFKYLTLLERDEEWGITVNTVGYQSVDPGEQYPPSNHPSRYAFKLQGGRVLNEYQMVYITRGEGYFCSKSCKMQKVIAGTIILLFPGEWHNYYPNPDTGWKEYWVGFSGEHIDNRVKKGFFTREDPIYTIGINSDIVQMYKNILSYAAAERVGYQQMISSIVLHIFGLIYFHQNNNEKISDVVLKIDEARQIMRNNIEQPFTPEEIATKLGLGYTWFRRMFKKYTGFSPAQYQAQMRLLISKELLTTTSLKINEIAYRLNFETGSQFATFFKKYERITPSEYRANVQSAFVDDAL